MLWHSNNNSLIKSNNTWQHKKDIDNSKCSKASNNLSIWAYLQLHLFHPNSRLNPKLTTSTISSIIILSLLEWHKICYSISISNKSACHNNLLFNMELKSKLMQASCPSRWLPRWLPKWLPRWHLRWPPRIVLTKEILITLKLRFHRLLATHKHLKHHLRSSLLWCPCSSTLSLMSFHLPLPHQCCHLKI